MSSYKDQDFSYQHAEWLGYLQPEGLVVSPPALIQAQAYLPDADELKRLGLKLAELVSFDEDLGERVLDRARLGALLFELLGWEPDDLIPGSQLPDRLRVALPEHHDLLEAEHGVRDPVSGEPFILIQTLPTGASMDRVWSGAHDDDEDHNTTGWSASPHHRLERLMRESGVNIGLLHNGQALRLIYAPRGESTGSLTFPFEAMCQPAGRPILGGLWLLLSADRLFTYGERERLPALLAASRSHQAEVSQQLASQVLEAMILLLAGFQAADEAQGGELLRYTLRADPQHIYGGLLATILRMVFILYAEDRELMPAHPIYTQHYALLALFEKLREDEAAYPDTMSQRFGAWARILALFRLIYDGGQHGDFTMPPRQGDLFDPDTYPFLEGRRQGVARQRGQQALELPRVSDGCVLGVLSKLLLLSGQRLSYRALDVEQIGSVYEGMMGFDLHVTRGRSVALLPYHVIVDLDHMLSLPAAKRADHLQAEADFKPTTAQKRDLKAATTIEELAAALDRKRSPLTPELLPVGVMALQPGHERRRSGSHYTPRELTGPIVERTLEPVIAQLGPSPKAEALLELKVCDPSMGSGAFLVECCRYLAERVVEAWAIHHDQPTIPIDEDPLLHARRLVAQRCLYGVDRNKFAVDLAKLSLWLVTLARQHPFTFVDHALRHGDTLVGLSLRQIIDLHWEGGQLSLLGRFVHKRIDGARALREQITKLGDTDDNARKQELLIEAEDKLDDVRLLGDLVISAFFAEDKKKAREDHLSALSGKIQLWVEGKLNREELALITRAMRHGDPDASPPIHPVTPFHWEVEFPEVFEDDDFKSTSGGFDAFVGNPPFVGGSKISGTQGDAYLAYLLMIHPGAHGNADLAAHFFRRAFDLLRPNGTMGLIATNTIAQGDTRTTGLAHICTHGGDIYYADKRYKWPGQAAVIVSLLNIIKGTSDTHILNAVKVNKITAFLFHSGGNLNPVKINGTSDYTFAGSKIYGQGFIFDDKDDKSNPLSTMEELIKKDPKNKQLIHPYIGGSEINESPTQTPQRYVINFEEMTLSEASNWPDVLTVVEQKVKPDRMKLRNTSDGIKLKQNWWQYGRTRPELYSKIKKLPQCLANSLVSKHLSFSFMPTNIIFSQKLSVFPLYKYCHFAILQSRIHEVFARFFSSTMKDDLSYSPSSCFETFPAPIEWDAEHEELEEAGRAYYEYRAGLMVARDEGLTKTYNRFHDPEESSEDIVELRRLHQAMDEAVLRAYGWDDLKLECEFLLDYEEDEEDEEGTSRKKKPYRLRWPEALHDEVLARLVELNAQRAKGQ